MRHLQVQWDFYLPTSGVSNPGLRGPLPCMFYLFTCYKTPDSMVKSHHDILQKSGNPPLVQIRCVGAENPKTSMIMALKDQDWTPRAYKDKPIVFWRKGKDWCVRRYQDEVFKPENTKKGQAWWRHHVVALLHKVAGTTKKVKPLNGSTSLEVSGQMVATWTKLSIQVRTMIPTMH